MHPAGCVCRVDAAWACNVLQGAACVSDTKLLALVWPVCTGQSVGPAPDCTDHQPGRMNHVPGRIAARSYPL